MRAGAVVNPVAGRGRTLRGWPVVRARLVEAGWQLEEWRSERPGHAVDLAARLAERGCEAVLAVGGDGTANEVTNGLWRAGALGRVALGLVALGTANDFATCLGVARGPGGAADALLSGRRRRVDVGEVNGRCFVNVAGVGFDAEVEVRTDRERWRARVFLVAVGNTPAYAGGVRMCPFALPDDGALEVVRIGDIRKVEVLWVLPLLYAGRHLAHPKVARASCRELVVESDPPLSVHADGEPVGRTPAHFRLHPQALDVLVPEARLKPVGMVEKGGVSKAFPGSPT